MAEPKNVGERIATVEARLEAYEDDIKEIDADLKKVVSKLDKIDKELSRYRGFVGGVLLVVTAIVTFLKFFGSGIVNFFND